MVVVNLLWNRCLKYDMKIDIQDRDDDNFVKTKFIFSNSERKWRVEEVWEGVQKMEGG